MWASFQDWVRAGAFRYQVNADSITVRRLLPIPLAAAPDAAVVTVRARESRQRIVRANGSQQSDARYWAQTLGSGRRGLPMLWLLITILAVVSVIAIAAGSWLIFAAAFFLGIALIRLNRTHRMTVLLYDLDDESRGSFDDLSRAVGWLRAAASVRYVFDSPGESEDLSDVMTNSVSAGTGAPEAIRTNCFPAWVSCGSAVLFFFPDVILVQHHGSFSFVRYQDLKISIDTRQLVESKQAPRDGKVVGTTWQHVTRTGRPDRRYRDNRELKIVEYSRVTIRESSWSVVLLISRKNAAAHFADGLAQFAGTTVRTLDMKTLPSVSIPQPNSGVGSPAEDRPVTINAGDERRASYSIRSAMSSEQPADPDEIWVPKDHPVSVGEYRIESGLIYVGQGLHGRWREPDPALVDSSLDIGLRHPGVPETMGYWPSYSRITPANRAGYLEWLRTGRVEPTVQIGYVFLFFYGLERRALVDANTSERAKNERPVIADEVERLLEIYGEQRSFRTYAMQLRWALDLLQSQEEPYYHRPAPAMESTWEMPPILSLALGHAARDGAPLPADWALAWLRAHPENRLRTPAHRCAEEFDRLFILRYQDSFGDGLTLRPGKSEVKLQYRPASAAIGRFALPVETPSVLAESATIRKLVEVAESCSNDLDGFSRWLGKNPQGRSSFAALAHLPRELNADEDHEEAEALRNLLRDRFREKEMASVALEELLFFFPSANPQKLRKNEAVMLAQALEHLGYGMEPDVRFGGKSIGAGDSIVIFPQPDEAAAAPSSAYAAATVLLHLAAMVATADDHIAVVELDLMSAHISRSLDLAEDEQLRLRAHLEWVLKARPGTAGLKKRLKGLAVAQRESIGDFLVAVAAADGHIAPAEVDALTKIYDLIGLDSGSLFSILHAAAIKADGESVETVEQAPSLRRPSREDPRSPVDMKLVERKIADTAAVSALLGNIFREDDEPAPVVTVSDDARIFAGLDPRHSRLLIKLTEQTSWRRDHLEAIAGDLDLMVDGALEAINDIAFERVGEPIWEGDDPIELNLEVAGEVMQ